MPPFSGNSFDTVTGTFYVNGQPVWKGADQMSISVPDHITINTESISNIVGTISGNIDCSEFISTTPANVYWKFEPIKKPEPEKKAEPEKESFMDKKMNIDVKPFPTVDNYWEQEGNKLVVKWTDGTITTVTAEDPERATLFAGICIAFAKKVLGSTTAMAKQIETVQKKKDWPRRRREIIKERLKELKKAKREIDAEIRENKIKRRMEELAIDREAMKRYYETIPEDQKVNYDGWTRVNKEDDGK